LRLSSDWNGYSRAFGNQACSDVVAEARRSDGPQDAGAVMRDGFPAAGTIHIGPYSVLVLSQDNLPEWHSADPAQPGSRAPELDDSSQVPPQ